MSQALHYHYLTQHLPNTFADVFADSRADSRAEGCFTEFLKKPHRFRCKKRQAWASLGITPI